MANFILSIALLSAILVASLNSPLKAHHKNFVDFSYILLAEAKTGETNNKEEEEEEEEDC